ncbi:hypothetical protein AALB39_21010 [Lachnospiraceae bacterium 54-53]
MFRELPDASLEEQIEEMDLKIQDLQKRKKQLMIEKERKELRLFVEAAEKEGVTPAELAKRLLAW